jgi:hypothetical protein
VAAVLGHATTQQGLALLALKASLMSGHATVVVIPHYEIRELKLALDGMAIENAAKVDAHGVFRTPPVTLRNRRNAAAAYGGLKGL